VSVISCPASSVDKVVSSAVVPCTRPSTRPQSHTADGVRLWTSHMENCHQRSTRTRFILPPQCTQPNSSSILTPS